MAEVAVAINTFALRALCYPSTFTLLRFHIWTRRPPRGELRGHLHDIENAVQGLTTPFRSAQGALVLWVLWT